MFEINRFTDKEKQVYRFLVDFTTQNMYAPTTEEICQGTGIKAKSTVNSVLKDLDAKGLIEVVPRTPRGIRIVGYKLTKEDKKQEE